MPARALGFVTHDLRHDANGRFRRVGQISEAAAKSVRRDVRQTGFVQRLSMSDSWADDVSAFGAGEPKLAEMRCKPTNFLPDEKPDTFSDTF